MKLKASWLRHLELLKAHRLSEIWVLGGPEGSGKTSTALGIVDGLENDLGWKWTDAVAARADVLLWDDASTRHAMHKRNWKSSTGNKLLQFLRAVRTLFTLVIITAPSIDDLDKAIRDSQIIELIEVISPGFAIWRDPISVIPRWQSEEWRRDLAISLAQSLKK